MARVSYEGKQAPVFLFVNRKASSRHTSSSIAVSSPVAIRSARSASSTRGTSFGVHVNIALLWRATARCLERGAGKASPLLDEERKPLDLGERFGQDQDCYGTDRLPEPLPPSVGALVFLGVGARSPPC